MTAKDMAIDKLNEGETVGFSLYRWFVYDMY